jgi:predicted RNA polymerase sigma factor
LRLAREHKGKGTLPTPSHAGQALRIAGIDEVRQRMRQKAVPRKTLISIDDEREGLKVEEAAAEDVAQQRLEFMEMVDAVIGDVGEDAAEMTMKFAAGWTEVEIDAARAPGSPTTGALRKRVIRARPQLAKRLNIMRRF